MLVVHHLNHSRSQRILWLLEELALPYEIKAYERNAKTLLAPPELRAIHPLGKSPLITDGERVVAESGAIIEYVLNRYGQGRLRPEASSPDLDSYTYFLHYAEGSAMPPLVLSLIFSRLPKAPMPFFMRPVVRSLVSRVKASYINPQIELHLDFLEQHLEKNAWFAGASFSAADIQMSFPIEAAMKRGPGTRSRPRLSAFLERIQARPAYQAARAKGGPSEVLGA